MKILCETTGSFMLVDYSQGGVEVQAHRPSVVENSMFINARATKGQVRTLAELVDDATDAEFEQYLKDSDGKIDLAVSSFLAKYGAQSEVSKKISKAPKAEK